MENSTSTEHKYQNKNIQAENPSKEQRLTCKIANIQPLLNKGIHL